MKVEVADEKGKSTTQGIEDEESRIAFEGCFSRCDLAIKPLGDQLEMEEGDEVDEE